MYRLFYPKEHRRSTGIRDIEVHKNYTHLRGIASEDFSLVVEAKGACRNHGHPTKPPVPAIGVFFGADNPLNVSEKLPLVDANSQRVELCAVLRALEIVRQSIAPSWSSAVAKGRSLATVVIKSDAEYVTKAMTSWVYTWRENGWRRPKSQPIYDETLFRLLWQECEHLRLDWGVTVTFWNVSVPKGMSEKKKALNGNVDGARFLAQNATSTPDVPFWDYRQLPICQEVATESVVTPRGHSAAHRPTSYHVPSSACDFDRFVNNFSKLEMEYNARNPDRPPVNLDFINKTEQQQGGAPLYPDSTDQRDRSQQHVPINIKREDESAAFPPMGSQPTTSRKKKNKKKNKTRPRKRSSASEH